MKMARACSLQELAEVAESLRADESRRWTDGFHFPPNLCHVYVF